MLHREDAYEAACGYAALFRGDETDSALAAGIRLHVAVESLVQFVDAHRKR